MLDDASIFQSGANPVRWLMSAYQLRRSAEVLWHEYDAAVGQMMSAAPDLSLPWHPGGIGFVATSLDGLPIELALKAILIGRKPALVKDGKLQKWGRSGHDLPGLAGTAELALSESDRSLLERLSVFVRWAGRYPIPNSLDELSGHGDTKIAASAGRFFQNEDRAAAKALFEHLEAQLRKEGTSFSPGG